jgi:hypothetical protein
MGLVGRYNRLSWCKACHNSVTQRFSASANLEGYHCMAPQECAKRLGCVAEGGKLLSIRRSQLTISFLTSILFVLGKRQKVVLVSSVGLGVMVRNNIIFYGEELLAPRPTPKLGDHPLSAVRDCLLNIFAATLHNWRPFLHPQPEDAPCRGDRDPLNTGNVVVLCTLGRLGLTEWEWVCFCHAWAWGRGGEGGITQSRSCKYTFSQ